MTLRTRTRTGALVASGAAVLLMVTLSGCGGSGSADDLEDAPVEHKSFAFSGKTLHIDAGDSAVELVSADVEDVEVTRRVDGWVVLGSGPNPVWKMDGDTLTLRVKCEAMISDCSSLHQVKVPRGVALDVDADNGRVSASGFDTRLELGSDNGRVVVRDSSGALDLRSNNGAVVAERVSAKSVEARSDNGSVELAFTGVPDLVDTVSSNGRIVVELPKGERAYAVAAESDNGAVSVRVPRSDSSTHVVKARSSNGEVTVRSAN